ncbi:hypothetical protein CUC43_25690 [Bacillus thuringiensis LM1212]|uniref:hypothetical protein n=1 Tax=Bacillus cereus group TaxID=86661 RepID=UPI0004107351|nr:MULTISPECIES: hypothetical protein [Bacillus cereus group]AXY09933.1 hypothetical protein CUC43_25690 [Bacillus thuringiensis LM1212]QDF22833.1 hypothetical protein FJR70_07265 [Bacillus tropicus]QUG96155.1 hypothetical protein HCM98_14955 [Bacillus tropicus]
MELVKTNGAANAGLFYFDLKKGMFMGEKGFYKSYKITVDTKVNVESEKIIVSQNDLNSAQLLISITQDSVPFLLEPV